MTVTLNVDVMNTTTESEAREAAFKLASGLTAEKKGRPASGPRAVVTGIVVNSAEDLRLPGDSRFLTDSEAIES